MLVDALGGLLDVPGVFAFGSNDHHGPRPINPLSYIVGPSSRSKPARTPLPAAELKAAFEASGWRDAAEQKFVMDVAGLSVEVRGTSDAHIAADHYPAVAGAPSAEVDLSLGVTHAPYLRLLDGMAADGVDLILAGHTHGGQVCVPVYGALVTNCDIDRHRVKGFSSHTSGGRTAALHVSAGLGTSPFAPYRFACPPEATLLTLVSRDA